MFELRNVLDQTTRVQRGSMTRFCRLVSLDTVAGFGRFVAFAGFGCLVVPVSVRAASCLVAFNRGFSAVWRASEQ